jgi:hypothetical protein
MSKFENEIRNKLKDFQAPANNGAWEDFISHNNKPKGWGYKQWVITGVVAVILSITAIILTTNNNTNKQKVDEINNQISNNSNNINQQNINNELTNENDKYISENSNTSNRLTIDNNPNSQITSNNSTNDIENSQKEQNELNTEVKEEGNSFNNENVVIEVETKNNNTNEVAETNTYNAQINVISNCLPGIVEFNAFNIDDDLKIEWNFGDRKKSSKKSINHTYNKNGLYKPTLLIFNQDDELIETIVLDDIIISNSPNSEFSFDINNNFYTFNSFSEQEVLHVWEVDGLEFNESSFEYEFTKDGSYEIKHIVTNKYECESSTIKNLHIDIKHNYFVPTAFRPLSNGINAAFGPIGEGIEDYTFRMLIFDRNGNLVFETDDINNLWNGKINGVGALADPGIYLWDIITIDKYGNTKTKKGQVNLLGN